MSDNLKWLEKMKELQKLIHEKGIDPNGIHISADKDFKDEQKADLLISVLKLDALLKALDNKEEQSNDTRSI